MPLALSVLVTAKSTLCWSRLEAARGLLYFHHATCMSLFGFVSYTASYKLNLHPTCLFISMNAQHQHTPRVRVRAQLLLDANTFELWWPVGYGAQPLYNFTFTYAPAHGSSNSTAVRALGMRKLELVREALGDTFSQGVGWETMFFRVNDVPIYAKGARLPLASLCATEGCCGLVEASAMQKQLYPCTTGVSPYMCVPCPGYSVS